MAVGFLVALQVKGQSEELFPDQVVSRDLAAQNTLSFKFAASPGLWRITLLQRDVDLALGLSSTDGPSRRSDGLEHGPETITFEAPQAGDFRVDVARSVSGSGGLGRFELLVRQWTPENSGPIDSAVDIETRLTRAKDLKSSGDKSSLEAARREYLELLGLMNRPGDAFRRAATLVNLGDVEYAFSRYREATRRYWQALDLTVGDKRLEAEVFNNLGTSHWRLGEPQAALENLNLAVTLWSESDFDYGLAASLSNRGILHWQVGEWQLALNDYDRAFALVEALGDRSGQAFILHNLGVALASLGRDEDAFDSLSRAADLFKALGARMQRARTNNELSRALIKRNQPTQAIGALEEAIGIFEAHGDSRAEAEARNLLGTAFRSMGKVRRSILEHDMALAEFRRIGSPWGEAESLRALGLAHGELGEVEVARERLLEALELHRQLADSHNEARTLHALALLDRRTGDQAGALKRIQEAVGIAESLRANVAGHHLRASFFATQTPLYEMLIDLLMEEHLKSPEAGFDEMALAASEKSRARSLLEEMREDTPFPAAGVSRHLLGRKREIQRELNFLSFQLLGSQGAEATRELRDKVNLLVARYQRLEAQIQGENPAYAQLTEPRIVSSGLARQLLPDDDTLLLFYFQGEQGFYLMALTRGAKRTSSLGSREEIDRLALEFAGAVSTRPDGAAEAGSIAGLAARVRERVLPPLGGLGRGRLVVVPQGSLSSVPFSALPPGPKGEPPIGQELLVFPSLSVMHALLTRSRQRRSASPRVAIFADPVFHRDDSRLRTVLAGDASASGKPSDPPSAIAKERTFSPSRLPFSDREARSILELNPGATAFLGFQASKSNFLATPLEDFDVIHIATHTLHDQRNPELSGVVFSLFDEHGNPQDGLVRLHEIYDMRLRAWLVALSACRSGWGKPVPGEGWISLSRGFLHAGAGSVLMSLWQVDDEASAELMRHFYRGLAQGSKPAAALSAAQRAIRAEKRWKSAFYWSGWVFQGPWDNPGTGN